jgi:undecaprenyl-diphosphatase
MSFLDAILFGLIQGLTEFIPVSSTAHIVLLAKLLGVETPGLTFEIFLHIASLLAVIIYFWRDLWSIVTGFLRCLPPLIKEPKRFRLLHALLLGDLHLGSLRDISFADRVGFRFCVLLLIATFITGVLGILLSDWLGDAIKSTPLVAGALLFTALCLVLVEWVQRVGVRPTESMTWVDAVVIGLAQTIAVLPGISRSGATLIAGLAMHLSRETAVRFSFLLAIPVLTGTALLGIRKIGDGDLEGIPIFALVLSFIISFIASIVSIRWLIQLLKKQRLYWFAIYLSFLAVATLLWL